MLQKAMRLCEAAFGELQIYEDGRLREVALHGVPPALANFRSGNPVISAPGTVSGRLVEGMNVVCVDDLMAEEAYRTGAGQRRALVDLGGARSYLAVALRKDDRLRGAIGIYRQEVRPFSDKQITLLQNFAAQAVVAMENARLLTETREALEQQTATAEVLQVINSSPGNLAPVFDAMVEKAMRLCEASIGGIYSYEREAFRAVALRGVPEAYAEFLHQEPLRPVANSGLGRINSGERVVHIPDVWADEAYGPHNPAGRTLLELGGARTVLLVSLTKDDNLLGAIFAYRKEVRPFTDKQIALLENFAAQAVIAMENARLQTASPPS
jgi:GAF domain-containing protein